MKSGIHTFIFVPELCIFILRVCILIPDLRIFVLRLCIFIPGIGIRVLKGCIFIPGIGIRVLRACIIVPGIGIRVLKGCIFIPGIGIRVLRACIFIPGIGIRVLKGCIFIPGIGILVFRACKFGDAFVIGADVGLIFGLRAVLIEIAFMHADAVSADQVFVAVQIEIAALVKRIAGRTTADQKGENKGEMSHGPLRKGGIRYTKPPLQSRPASADVADGCFFCGSGAMPDAHL